MSFIKKSAEYERKFGVGDRLNEDHSKIRDRDGHWDGQVECPNTKKIEDTDEGNTCEGCGLTI